jgi:hypothetical protein
LGHFPLNVFLLSQVGISILENYENITDVAEDRLSRVSLVQSIPILKVSPRLSLWLLFFPLTHSPNSKIDQVWSRFGFSGQGATIAILDTGIQTSHPAFSGRIVHEACFSTNSSIQNSFTLCPNMEDTQTGTLVALFRCLGFFIILLNSLSLLKWFGGGLFVD